MQSDPRQEAKRVPCEDLRCLTVAQRGNRHKAAARLNSKPARLRAHLLIKDSRKDVKELSVFRAMVKKSPHIVMFLSIDLDCTILYAIDHLSASRPHCQNVSQTLLNIVRSSTLTSNPVPDQYGL